MSPEITIRPLSAGDVPKAAEALSAWMVEAFKGQLPDAVVATLTPERALKRLRDPGLRNTGCTLAAYEGERLIALGQCAGTEITLLYTHPAARGAGIGAALLDRLKDDIRAAGHPTAELVVLVANTGARRFYERQGGRVLRPDNVHLAGHDLPHYRYAFDLEARGDDE